MRLLWAWITRFPENLNRMICYTGGSRPGGVLHVRFANPDFQAHHSPWARPRCAILAQLEREDGASVSELARPFAIKLPAVMKHLDVLDDAGLITRSKRGRTVTVRLSPQPMRAALEWLRRYERFWSVSLDRLTAYAERKEAEARRGGR